MNKLYLQLKNEALFNSYYCLLQSLIALIILETIPHQPFRWNENSGGHFNFYPPVVPKGQNTVPKLSEVTD